MKLLKVVNLKSKGIMVLMTSYIEMRERRGKDHDRKGEGQIESKRGKKLVKLKNQE